MIISFATRDKIWICSFVKDVPIDATPFLAPACQEAITSIYPSYKTTCPDLRIADFAKS